MKKILNIRQAAKFLMLSPEGLRRLSADGKVPAAKLGGRWVFIEDDLADYLRSLYAESAKVSQGVVESLRRTTWDSAKEVMSGGLESVMVEDEYKKALGLATN